MEGRAWGAIGPDAWSGIAKMEMLSAAETDTKVLGVGVGACSGHVSIGRFVPVHRRPDDPASTAAFELPPPETP